MFITYKQSGAQVPQVSPNIAASVRTTRRLSVDDYSELYFAAEARADFWGYGAANCVVYVQSGEYSICCTRVADSWSFQASAKPVPYEEDTQPTFSSPRVTYVADARV